MEMVLDSAVVMMTMGSLQNVQADLILMLVGITKQSQLQGAKRKPFGCVDINCQRNVLVTLYPELVPLFVTVTRTIATKTMNVIAA